MSRYISTLIIILTLSSCEKVIDLEVPNSQERLVIEASINWFDGTDGNEQKVILTKTAQFFDNQISPATNANVSITDSNNNTVNFIDVGNNGVYKTTNFSPILNETYTLSILYNNEQYTATETLLSVTPIDFIEQENGGGFSGEEVELKAYYTDPANELNHYFFEFFAPTTPLPSLRVYKDEFIDGNQIFAFYRDEDLEQNDEVIINNYGVSQAYYDYMDLLLQQVSDSGGGPFQAQPATVRGNCINTTSPNNYPLGYFRLSQAFTTTYTVE